MNARLAFLFAMGGIVVIASWFTGLFVIGVWAIGQWGIFAGMFIIMVWLLFPVAIGIAISEANR